MSAIISTKLLFGLCTTQHPELQCPVQHHLIHSLADAYSVCVYAPRMWTKAMFIRWADRKPSTSTPCYHIQAPLCKWQIILIIMAALHIFKMCVWRQRIVHTKWQSCSCNVHCQAKQPHSMNGETHTHTHTDVRNDHPPHVQFIHPSILWSFCHIYIYIRLCVCLYLVCNAKSNCKITHSSEWVIHRNNANKTAHTTCVCVFVLLSCLSSESLVGHAKHGFFSFFSAVFSLFVCYLMRLAINVC